MLNEILARRVLIVLGKGGVGKTTVSAALAKLAAMSGARALIMECDGRAPLAATFGVAPSFVPTDVAPNLALMTLDGRAALEEYLRLVVPGRMLLKAVFASRLYQFFVQAAPGLRELMMLGKIYHEAGRTDAKLPGRRIIIVDAPASGQAMSLLKMPTAARSTFGDSVVGKEAGNISRMMRDRRNSAIIQVTTADSLSISETIETHANLSRIHLAPAAVLFNRMPRSEFDADDISALTNRRGPHLRKKDLEHLAELARSELNRVADARKAIAKIRAETGGPVLEIAEHGDLSGIERDRKVESGEIVQIGVNAFTGEVGLTPRPKRNADHAADARKEKERIESIKKWRAARDQAAVSKAREALERAAANNNDGDRGLIEATIELARAGGTVGEWTDSLVRVSRGRYTPPILETSVSVGALNVPAAPRHAKFASRSARPASTDISTR